MKKLKPHYGIYRHPANYLQQNYSGDNRLGFLLIKKKKRKKKMVKLYHFCKAKNLGIPGRGHIMHEAQVESLQDVPWLPWLNGGHIATKTSPIELKPEEIEKHVESFVDDETKILHGGEEIMCIDLEHPMNPTFLPQDGLWDIYKEAIILTKHYYSQAVDNVWRTNALKVGVYCNLHNYWRHDHLIGNQHFWHSQVMPFVDYIILSCYNLSKKTNWEAAMQEDLQQKTEMIRYHKQNYVKKERPLMLFVWSFNQGKSQHVPFEMWKDYIKSLIQLLDEDDKVCWFGLAKEHQSYHAEIYAERINWLKKYISKINERRAIKHG